MPNELTAPVLKQDDERQIVFGPVLVPDEPDSDGDVVTAEKIEEVAHKFVEDYGNIDLQHSLNNVGRLVESYVAPSDIDVEVGEETAVIPKGSWVMGVRVTQKESWDAVKSGQLTGFSIMGVAKEVLKSKHGNDMQQAAKNSALKKTTLEDLGPGWEVNAVSLVDDPAVPAAKFLSIKSKNKGPASTETVAKAVQGSIEDRRRLVEDKMDEDFWHGEQIPFIHSTFQDSVVIRVIRDTEPDKLVQLSYEISDEGEVTFTGEPVEVQIREEIVPVESGDENGPATLNQSGSQPKTSGKAAADSATLESVLEQSEIVFNSIKSDLYRSTDKTFKERIMEFMTGVPPAEKAGRSISEANYNNLLEMKSLIDDMVEQADKERANKSAGSEGQDMTEQEVKQLVQNEVQKSVESSVENSMASVKEAMTETIKSQLGQSNQQEQPEGDGEDQGEPSAKSKGEGQEEGGEATGASQKGQSVTLSAEEYEEMNQALEAHKNRRLPLSQRITGQDEPEQAEKQAGSEIEEDRDALGRKKK